MKAPLGNITTEKLIVKVLIIMSQWFSYTVKWGVTGHRKIQQ